jgi:hypothetical protein
MRKRRQENERDQQGSCGAGTPAREMSALAMERRAPSPVPPPDNRGKQADKPALSVVEGSARPTQSLHILIPKSSLKTNPATIDKMKNSQIQFIP